VVKNDISHRAQACQRMLELIRQQWGISDAEAASSVWPWQHA